MADFSSLIVFVSDPRRSIPRSGLPDSFYNFSPGGTSENSLRSPKAEMAPYTEFSQFGRGINPPAEELQVRQSAL